MEKVLRTTLVVMREDKKDVYEHPCDDIEEIGWFLEAHINAWLAEMPI